jgi:hypothetical protein
MTSGVAARLEIFDPGFVRPRRGVRAVCATVLAWATMVAVTSAFDVAEPVRITLFAAGAAFEGALLAPDPQPRDRLRTLGWAGPSQGSPLLRRSHSPAAPCGLQWYSLSC